MTTSSSRVAGVSGQVILLASVFLVAACGLVYELVAGAVSSYLLGDAVTQFSLVIGVFLCAMGVGSYLAKFIQGNLLRTFLDIEIAIGLVGGLSSIVMFAVSAFFDPAFPVVFYGLCSLIGILIGIEIPLLIRILKEHEGFLHAVSNVLALDYIGALAGALLFPLLALPYLGLSRASVVFGLLNLVVAAFGLTLLKDRRWAVMARLASAAGLLLAALVWSGSVVGYLEDLHYQDSIVFSQSTPYQRIVLTRWNDDVRLYLNGHIQFSSVDEARYHESLVIPAMEAAGKRQKVLILGGGDGLAAREVLKYTDVQQVTLVDLDPAITQLGQHRKELAQLNQGALNHPKVRIINQDGMSYLEQSRGFYDVIIIDLPDPNSEALTKLYSTAFYALCHRRMALGGVLVTQATSPYYAPEVFWCIARTMEQAVSSELPGLKTLPYHVHVPSFGEWGFILAGKHTIIPGELAPSVSTRFLTPETMRAMFAFGKDLRQHQQTEINRLDHPVLFQYYKQGWKRFNQ